MNIKAARKTSAQSADKLRRARRLYAYLTSAAIAKQPETAIPLAYRAQAAGLYSTATSVNSICFSLLRYAHKHHGNDSWLNWAEQTGARHLWFKCAEYYRRNGDKLIVKKKPRVRIAA